MLNLVIFEAGDEIVHKGDRGDVCYFIKEGEVECTHIGTNDGSIKLGQGSFFGERACLPHATGAPCKHAAALVVPSSRCLSLKNAVDTNHWLRSISSFQRSLTLRASLLSCVV